MEKDPPKETIESALFNAWNILNISHTLKAFVRPVDFKSYDKVDKLKASV